MVTYGSGHTREYLKFLEVGCEKSFTEDGTIDSKVMTALQIEKQNVRLNKS